MIALEPQSASRTTSWSDRRGGSSCSRYDDTARWCHGPRTRANEMRLCLPHNRGPHRASLLVAGLIASVEDPLPILDTGIVSPGNLRDDILAFKLLPPSRIHALSLSAQPPTSGDRVRVVVLEATRRTATEVSKQDLSVEFEVRELYARVVDANAEILIYAFEADLPAPHSPGAPVLDTAGDVIGVHVSTMTHAGVTYGAAAPATSLIDGITSARAP